GTVFAAGALGDDPFQTEAACMAQNQVAIFVEMLAVSQLRAGILEQMFKRGLAIEQSHVLHVLSIQIKEIESKEDEAVAAPLAQIGLKGRKVGGSTGPLDHDLAVDDGLTGRQGGESRGNRL